MNWLRTWTCLNALEGNIWKSDQKILMDEKRENWKSNQNIVMDEELIQNGVMAEELIQDCVMDEELIQNGVMDEKFVKNSVTIAQIDPKVVMDLSIFFKFGGWNSLQPINQNFLELFTDENEPWLLIGTPSRDSFLMIQYLVRHLVISDQHMKELMPLREGLHVTSQCYMRQHDACRRSTSWRESMMRKFMKGPICRWNVQKIRSESSEYMWETTGAFYKQLENQNSLGELLRKTCTGNLGQKSDWILICILCCWTRSF